MSAHGLFSLYLMCVILICVINDPAAPGFPPFGLVPSKGFYTYSEIVLVTIYCTVQVSSLYLFRRKKEFLILSSALILTDNGQ